MDILAKATSVSIGEYEAASYEVVRDRWLEYECEESDRRSYGYYPLSAYYVDDREIKAITSLDRTELKTCFHEHYDHPHQTGRNKFVPVGERRNHYQKYLRYDEQGEMVRKLRIIFDATA